MRLDSRNIKNRKSRTKHPSDRQSRKNHAINYFIILFLIVFICVNVILLVKYNPSIANNKSNTVETDKPNHLRKSGSDIPQFFPGKKLDIRKAVTSSIQEQKSPAVNEKPGFVVLGMHRSGTSMLSGLMVMGLGYKVGSPTIGGLPDNPKGFFELLPVVLQNDIFLGKQKSDWSYNVQNFNFETTLAQHKRNEFSFDKAERALRFFNDEKNSPWLQKDPRMCITLKVWLNFFNHEPAAVLTYRHPLEVARSLESRDKTGVEFFRGLRLWIIYNMRAIQNSSHMCRVYTSNEAVIADPLNEVQRISDELTTKCGVQSPPKKISKSVVDQFFDPNLQHGKKGVDFIESRILETHSEDCVVYDIEHGQGTRTKAQTDLYINAMKIYCDLKNGSAYKDNYIWPTIG